MIALNRQGARLTAVAAVTGVFATSLIATVGVQGASAVTATPSPIQTVNSPYAINLISTTATGGVTDATNNYGGHTAVSVSRDGRYVAFMSDASDLPGAVADSVGSYGASLYVKDTQTGAVRQIAHSANSNFAISADGSTVAFVGRPADYGMSPATTTPLAGLGYTTGDLIAYKLATGTYTRVSHAGVGYNGVTRVAVSADGNSFVYETETDTDTGSSGIIGGGKLYDNFRVDYGVAARSLRSGSEVAVVAGSVVGQRNALVPILNGAHPAISEDGSHVAFVATEGADPILGKVGVKVVDVSTGKITAVALPSGDTPSEVYPALNANGSVVVLAQEDGSGPDDYPTTPDYPGTRNVQSSVWITDLRSGSSAQVPQVVASGSASNFASVVGPVILSSDGQRLLYQAGPVSVSNGVNECRFVAYDLATKAQWVVGGEYPCGTAVALAGPGDNQIFLQTALSLIAADTNGGTDVYRVSVGTPRTS